MIKPAPVILSTGDVVADVEAALHELAAGLSDTETSSVVASMVELAERSERARTMAERFGERRRSVLAARLREAVGAGQLRDDVDLDLLVGQLVGPLFYRRYISRQATPRAFVTRLASSTLRPLLAPPASARAGRDGSPR
jgi:hypothetical protein